MKVFPCTSCGECCKNVHLSEHTAYLDRGDGICHHFDEASKRCSIYEHRPLICRVEDYYHQFLTEAYTWDEFVKINLDICHTLQAEAVSVVKFYDQ